jgi:hypothetical protein
MMVVVLPQGGPRARFLFDFDARACLAAPEQSLNARTGHVATFTRLGSIQQAADSAGILQRFASNLPAFQWNTDPVTGLSTPGVLLEVGATNLIVQSSDFANGVWGNVNVTVTANAITAPDGTLTADKLAATATGSALLYQFITTTATRASPRSPCTRSSQTPGITGRPTRPHGSSPTIAAPRRTSPSRSATASFTRARCKASRRSRSPMRAAR